MTRSGAASRAFGRAAIRVYQLTFSALAGRSCRHLPGCSDYASEAIARYGLWPGSWMGLARICRCGPLGTSGLDFVCDEVPGRARWYVPWRYGRWRGTNPQPGVTMTSTSRSSPLSTLNSRV